MGINNVATGAQPATVASGFDMAKQWLANGQNVSNLAFALATFGKILGQGNPQAQQLGDMGQALAVNQMAASARPGSVPQPTPLTPTPQPSQLTQPIGGGAGNVTPSTGGSSVTPQVSNGPQNQATTPLNFTTGAGNQPGIPTPIQLTMPELPGILPVEVQNAIINQWLATNQYNQNERQNYIQNQQNQQRIGQTERGLGLEERRVKTDEDQFALQKEYKPKEFALDERKVKDMETRTTQDAAKFAYDQMNDKIKNGLDAQRIGLMRQQIEQEKIKPVAGVPGAFYNAKGDIKIETDPVKLDYLNRFAGAQAEGMAIGRTKLRIDAAVAETVTAAKAWADQQMAANPKDKQMAEIGKQLKLMKGEDFTDQYGNVVVPSYYGSLPPQIQQELTKRMLEKGVDPNEVPGGLDYMKRQAGPVINSNTTKKAGPKSRAEVEAQLRALNPDEAKNNPIKFKAEVDKAVKALNLKD